MDSSRPRFHITPPKGWMNDPCAPWYDSESKIYHIYFQFVPETVYWTHKIGWGHAWSTDLINWETDPEPILMPSEEHDSMGVFTGTMFPSIEGDPLKVVYTAINSLVVPGSPDYVNGQERLAIATSNDRGKTWDKPLDALLDIKPPPQVGGWRDPYVGPWSELANLLDKDQDTIFGIVCGSLIGKGPTVFLYEVTDEGMSWSYLGPLVHPTPSPSKPPSAWVGDHGYNFECTNAFELGGQSYLVISPQAQFFEFLEPQQPDAPKEGKKWQLWATGQIKLGAEGPVFDIQQEGVLDWGCLYAAQTFADHTGRRLLIGWLPDDDLHTHHREIQTWSGTMSLVREVFQQVTPGITGALHARLEDIPGLRLQEKETSYTVETLGVRPAKEIEAARSRSIPLAEMERSSYWEVSLEATLTESTELIGLQLTFAEGSAQIIYEPHYARIVVRRNQSNADDTIGKFTEHGKHTLFKTQDGYEPLRLRVFYDQKVLEVFANDRFSLCTHLYGGPCSVSAIQAGAESIITSVWDNAI